MSVATGFHLFDQHLRCPSYLVQDSGDSPIEIANTNSDKRVLFQNKYLLYSVSLSYPVQRMDVEHGGADARAPSPN